MSLIDLTVEARGFAPFSIGLAVRTVATCYAMQHRPDDRALCGVGMVTVRPDAAGTYSVGTAARCLQESETPADLLDWLNDRLPHEAAIVSFNNWGSVPRRMLALANADRHSHLIEAANDTAGRWRDLPRGHTWHVRQSRASAVPCLCPPAAQTTDCQAVTPAGLLPDPDITAGQLIGEAVAGWQSWARDFGDVDDDAHPARQALRALDRWRLRETSSPRR